MIHAAKGQYFSKRVSINYNCTNTSISVLFPSKTKFEGSIEMYMSKYARLTFGQFMLAIFILILYCGQGRRRDRPRENPALRYLFKVLFYLIQLPFHLLCILIVSLRQCYLERSFEKKKDALIAKIVAQVKFQKEKAEFNQDKCAICLEYFEEGRRVTSLNCKHLFHNGCIGTWLKEKERADMNCPMCHKNIFELADSTEAEIHLINLSHINNRLEMIEDPREMEGPPLDPEESLRRRIQEMFPPRRIRVENGQAFEEDEDGDDQNTDDGGETEQARHEGPQENGDGDERQAEDGEEEGEEQAEGEEEVYEEEEAGEEESSRDRREADSVTDGSSLSCEEDPERGGQRLEVAAGDGGDGGPAPAEHAANPHEQAEQY